MRRTDRPGFWRRLFGGEAGEIVAAEAPPLFRARPVPPPPPKGPGLPEWHEILSDPPPVPEPGSAPAPSVRLVRDAAPPPSPAAPATRAPTEAERQVLAQIDGLLGAGQATQAAALLDATFRARPDACDAQGRPIYLVQALRCALALGAPEQAAEHARQLRPHLAPDDPVVEVLHARAAGQRAAARAYWLAALARNPDLADARDWLAAHPGSPDGGFAVTDLLGPAGTTLAMRTPPPPALQPAPPQPPELPDWLPARLLTDAAVTVDHDGVARPRPMAEAEADGVVPRPVPGETPGDLALQFRHPEGLSRPHAFAEVLLAAFVIQRQFLGHLRPARLYVGRQPWVRSPAADAGGNAASSPQAEQLAVLFPGLRVIADHEGAVREANVLVVDGAVRNAATGTLIGSMMPWVRQWSAEARARAHAACGLPESAEPPRTPGRRQRVLYLHAAPPRTLAEPVRDRLFALFIAAGYDVAMADVAAMPWQRQVRLAYGADIITGAHGPGFDVVLWGHPSTRVLEFFPEGARRYDGQLLAEAAELAYLGLEGLAERGFVVNGRERSGPPVGHANRMVWTLPWAILEQGLAPPGSTAATQAAAPA